VRSVLVLAALGVLATGGFAQEPPSEDPAPAGGEQDLPPQETPPEPQPQETPPAPQPQETPEPKSQPQDTPPDPQPQETPPEPQPQPQPQPQETPPEPDPIPAEVQPGPAAGATAPPADASATPAAEPAPSHPPVTWPLSSDGILAHLHAVAARSPELAVVQLLGQSVGGREIAALRLGVRAAEGAPAKPVLLLVDFQGSASAGPEAMLELAWQLTQDFAHDERVRALLTQAELVLAPALDPDVRSAPGNAVGAVPASARTVRFERNFPSGWQPDAVRPGSGRISLAQPETLAAARFLTELGGCGVLLGFVPSAPRGTPYAGSELPAADREVFAKLGAALEVEGGSSLVPWFELGTGGGGLFDFAYQARGIYPLAFALPSEEELAAGGLARFTAEVRARVLRCLTLLPRVEIRQEGLERLASDTWQLDVRIQNVGVVPTASALALERSARSDVVLHLDGAKLVATAKRPSSDADYTDASFQVRAPLSGGTLAGGEGRWLRLILEAGAGADVRVTASSPWAGSDALQVVLP
jgi:hypothetical protein